MINTDKRCTSHKRSHSKHSRLHWLIIGALIPMVALISSLQTDKVGAVRSPGAPTAGTGSSEARDGARVSRELAVPVRNSGQRRGPADSSSDGWQVLTVQPGDSLVAMLRRLNVPRADRLGVAGLADSHPTLGDLQPGQELRIRRNGADRLAELEQPLPDGRRLRVRRAEEGLEIRHSAAPSERRIRYATGVIRDSLFRAGRRAGLSRSLTMKLARIFAWDIDFAREIRPGDRFTVVHEEIYRAGSKLRDGEILAAEFHNRGRTLRAIRFEDGDGRTNYYTPQGRNVRKAFLRTPVDFTRISSRFRPDRKHPVLGGRRAHRGVDYAAPRGARVKATGAGRVAYRGSRDGYGKTLMLDHGGRYTTVYAHLSGFARDTAPGHRVAQGQTIGYVGSSGLATGPHLHYEFRVDGRHENPLEVELPRAEPIAQRLRPELRARARELVERMELVTRARLARHDAR